MSLRRNVNRADSALYGFKKAQVSLTKGRGMGTQITKTINEVKKASKEIQDEVTESISDTAYAYLRTAGENIKKRWKAKDFSVPGEGFHRPPYVDRTGALRNAAIKFKVAKTRARTLKGIRNAVSSIAVSAPEVPVRTPRAKPAKNYRIPKYLSKGTKNNSGGDYSDYFSLMERGTMSMRYSAGSYTTYDGEVISPVSGFFGFDRIVKSEMMDLERRMSAETLSQIRELLK